MNKQSSYSKHKKNIMLELLCNIAANVKALAKAGAIFICLPEQMLIKDRMFIDKLKVD